MYRQAVWWVAWDATDSGPRGRELVLLGKLALSFSSALQKCAHSNGGCHNCQVQSVITGYRRKHVNVLGMLVCGVGCNGVWTAGEGACFVGEGCVELLKRPAGM
jgi:hypothetical protein